MGGTNKIALNFIKELAVYCDVTLILSHNTGELLSEIPKDINIIIDELQDFKVLLKKDLRRLQIRKIVRDFQYYKQIKQHKDSIDNYKYIVDRNSLITEEVFDCAISYHGQSPERLLNLLYRVNSKKKVAWIHGEISFDQDKCERLEKYYQHVNHFFFVSESTKDSFEKIFPYCIGKSTVYYNPINKQEIVSKARDKAEHEFDPSFFNILTVGRLSKEKGQDMIPAIVALLKQNGIRVRWYLIGDGDTRQHIQMKIHDFDVEDSVFMLGTIQNPYPYIKNCSLYVQPSYTEGYSTTICEAGILGKAIIGTSPSGGIREQITPGYDGEVVDATVESLEQTIRALITNPSIIKKYEHNIMDKDFQGKGEIIKFLEYIEK